MARDDIVTRLRLLPSLRCRVETLDQALENLSEEERLVIEKMVIHPARGNADKLCEMLEIEPASVYRRRKKALKKLEEMLGGG